MNGHEGLLALAAAAGIVLIVMGLIRPSEARHFPAVIPNGSAVEVELRDQLGRIERAARTGDLPALRKLVETRYLDALESRLAELGGGRLDKMALHEQFGFVGDVGAMERLAGIGQGRLAVLVLRGPGVERDEVRMHAFVFDAGRGQLQLAGKRVRAVGGAPRPEALRSAAESWAREALAAVAPNAPR